ncbi:MAG: potassium/proton antiporter [Alistipes sp.]|nr:potassium/proton antiporter [Alistipes sp.]
MEHVLMVGALLLFVAVLAGKVAYKFGAPALLLFLGVGMVFGLKVVHFHSFELTQVIGMLSLCIILFNGGMDTKFSDIRPVIAPGVILATLGVILTAFFVGIFAYFFCGWIGLAISPIVALLLGATMSSTDSASVFSILRTKKQGLRENLRPMLELESGSNDPIAYIMTILLVSVATTDGSAGVWDTIFDFFVQMIVGALVGYGVGRLAVWTNNKIDIKVNPSLYSVLLLAFVYFSFSFASIAWGNGYLAVYITGLVVGNNRLAHRNNLMTFFDGFTWLAQIILFLAIGLLVNLDELLKPEVLVLGFSVGAFLMFVARPLSVLISLLPFRHFTTKARIYVSWVGLRGAVPIIFATYPILGGVENGNLLFNVVFIVTLLSLVVQGTTVSSMANWLGLAYEEKESLFQVGIPDNIKSNFAEIEITEAIADSSNTLKDIKLPDSTLVVLIFRDGAYFVPKGNTELLVGDRLLVVSDRSEEELQQIYEQMGITEIAKLR